MAAQLSYADLHISIALACSTLRPAIPPYCVHRPALMKHLVYAVLSQKFDPNRTTVCATV